MDLATIRDRLAPGASQGWGTITYKSIGEVLADVRLVWRNCRAYNGPNEPITCAPLCSDRMSLPPVRAVERSLPAVKYAQVESEVQSSCSTLL